MSGQVGGLFLARGPRNVQTGIHRVPDDKSRSEQERETTVGTEATTSTSSSQDCISTSYETNERKIVSRLRQGTRLHLDP